MYATKKYTSIIRVKFYEKPPNVSLSAGWNLLSRKSYVKKDKLSLFQNIKALLPYNDSNVLSLKNFIVECDAVFRNWKNLNEGKINSDYENALFNSCEHIYEVESKHHSIKILYLCHKFSIYSDDIGGGLGSIIQEILTSLGKRNADSLMEDMVDLKDCDDFKSIFSNCMMAMAQTYSFPLISFLKKRNNSEYDPVFEIYVEKETLNNIFLKISSNSKILYLDRTRIKLVLKKCNSCSNLINLSKYVKTEDLYYIDEKLRSIIRSTTYLDKIIVTLLKCIQKLCEIHSLSLTDKLFDTTWELIITKINKQIEATYPLILSCEGEEFVNIIVNKISILYSRKHYNTMKDFINHILLGISFDINKIQSTFVSCGASRYDIDTVFNSTTKYSHNECCVSCNELTQTGIAGYGYCKQHLSLLKLESIVMVCESLCKRRNSDILRPIEFIMPLEFPTLNPEIINDYIKRIKTEFQKMVVSARYVKWNKIASDIGKLNIKANDIQMNLVKVLTMKAIKEKKTCLNVFYQSKLINCFILDFYVEFIKSYRNNFKDITIGKLYLDISPLLWILDNYKIAITHNEQAYEELSQILEDLKIQIEKRKEDLMNGELSGDALKLAINYQYNSKKLWKQFNIEPINFSDIEKQYKESTNKFNTLINVVKELNSAKLIDNISVDLFIDVNKENTKKIRSVTNELEKLLGLYDDDLKTACYFINKKSTLFKVLLYEFKKNKSDSIAGAVKFAVETLQKLLVDENLKLNDVEFFSIYLKTHFTDIESELDILSNFFSSKISSGDLKTRLSLFSTAIKVKSFNNKLVIMTDVIEGLNCTTIINSSEYQKLVKLISTTNNNPSFIDTPSILEERHSLLGNEFVENHIEYFMQVKDIGELIKYLSEMDIVEFENKVERARGMQLSKYDEGILHDLVLARRYLEPILRPDQRKEISLEGLVHHIIEMLPDIETNQNTFNSLKALKRSGDVLQSSILNLLSGGKKTVVYKVDRLIVSGNVYSEITNSERYYLTYKESVNTNTRIIELEDDSLCEFIQGLLFQKSDENLAKDILNSLTLVANIYKLSKSIHDTRLSLHNIGNPEYQHSKKELCSFKESEKENLQNLDKYLKQKYNEWKTNCNITLQNTCSLNRLTSKQFYNFISQIWTMVNNNSIIIKDLLPYIQLIFPDIQLVDDTSTILNDLLEKTIVELKDNSDSSINTLHILSNWITLIEDKYNLEKGSKLIEGNSNNYSICFIDSKQDNFNIKLWITFNYKLNTQWNIPLASILYCTKITSTQDILMFLRRAYFYLDNSYIIIGVNELSHRVRDILYTNLRENTYNTAEIHLVFTKRDGCDIFYDLISGSSENIEEITIEKNTFDSIKTNTTIGDRLILNTITGKPANGKTHHALKLCNQFEGESRIIAINEGFSTLYLINIIRGLEEHGKHNDKFMIYFNISSDAPFELVSLMFFRLFACGGYISDDISGNVYKMNIQSFYWNIYIEIPTLLNYPNNSRKVLEYFPFFQYNAIDIDVDELSLDITNEYYNAAALLNIYTYCNSTNRIDFDNIISLGNNRLSENESKHLIENFFTERKLINESKFRKITAIKLLSMRLQNIIDNLNSRKVIDPQNYKNHFEHIDFKSVISLLINDVCILSNTSNEIPSDLMVISENDMDILNFSSSSLTIKGIGSYTRNEYNNCEYGRLRALTGLALETNSLIKILSNADYVLTPDLAIKIIILRDHLINCKLPLLISGDTGIGKTELLRVLAEILNGNDKVTPDIKYEFCKWLSNYGKSIQSDLGNNLVQLSDTFKKENDDIKSTGQIQANRVLQVIDPTDGQISDEDFLAFVEAFISMIKDLKKEYSLLVTTSITNSLLSVDKISNSFSINQFRQVLYDYFKMRPRSIFYKILMNEKYSISDLNNDINTIEKNLKELKDIDSNSKIIVFVDETNTTRIRGSLKEVFFDRLLNGKKISDDIVFVGAINPVTENKEFIVQDLPISMMHCQQDWKISTIQQERDILFNLIDFQKSIKYNKVNIDEDDGEFILSCQNFVRNQKIERVHVSIRDIRRCLSLYTFFFESDFLLECNNENDKHWKALLMSVTMAYYFRLPEVQNNKLRSKFCDEIIPCHNKYANNPYTDFEKLLQGEFDNLFDSMKINSWVAGTRILKENLFASVVCIQTKIPLIITGPPGTAKTLSFNITIENMKGPGPASTLKFKKLANTHKFTYQCSEFSTSTEIKQLFESALSQNKIFNSASQTNERIVVFIDEGGLAKENDNAMKVIHFYLDHPEVCCILLSNTTLDAAKTNRGIQLFQADSSISDVRALATSTILENVSNISNNQKSIIEGCCKAFDNIRSSDNTKFKNLFHLRDFVYFCRMLNDKCVDSNVLILTYPKLLLSLQRNFGGIEPNEFTGICNLFLQYIEEEFPTKTGYREFLCGYDTKNHEYDVLQCLRKSVHQKTKDITAQDAFRYILLIDHTNFFTLRVAFSLGIFNRETVKIHVVSNFEDEQTYYSRSNILSNIKDDMERGNTVILLNSGPLQSSFYDIFNLRFFHVMNNDGKLERCGNLAVGSFSRPCIVHPNFKIIIYMTMNEFENTPIPFINRFEKYLAPPENIIKLYANRIPNQISKGQMFKIFKSLFEGVKHFANFLQYESFYGVNNMEDLISSLIIWVIQLTYNNASSFPIIPNILPIKQDSKKILNLLEEMKVSIINDQGNIQSQQRALIRKLNFHLLQLVRPEVIFLKRTIIPKAYILEYIVNQEHFSISRFVNSFISFHHQNNELDNEEIDNNEKNNNDIKKESIITDIVDKYVIFSRSSSTIIRLEQSKIEKMVNIDNLPVKFLKLENYHSFSQIEDELKQWYNSENGGFLFVSVNRGMSSSISVIQINQVMSLIDEYQLNSNINSDYKYSTIFLIHFSPELLNLKPCYEALFLDGWSYTYIDGLGIEESSSTELSARDCLLVTFGLLDLTEDIGVNIFKEKLWNSIKSIITIIGMFASRVKLEHSSAFYNLRTATERINYFENNKEFLEKTLCAPIIKIFTSNWKRSLLDGIFESACNSVRSGKSSNAIMQIVKNRLERLLYEIVKVSLFAVIKNYSLEFLFTDKLQLFQKILSNLITINLNEITDSNTFINHSYERCTHIPLFSLIIQNMDKFWRQTLVICKKKGKSDFKSLVKQYNQILISNPTFQSIINDLNTDDNRILFILDYIEIHLKLGITGEYSIKRKLLLELVKIYSKSNDFNIIQTYIGINCSDFIQSASFISTIFSDIELELSPVLSKSDEESLEECNSTQQLFIWIQKFSIISLEKKLLEFLNINNEDDFDKDEINTWMRLFRTYRKQIMDMREQEDEIISLIYRMSVIYSTFLLLQNITYDFELFKNILNIDLYTNLTEKYSISNIIQIVCESILQQISLKKDIESSQSQLFLTSILRLLIFYPAEYHLDSLSTLEILNIINNTHNNDMWNIITPQSKKCFLEKILITCNDKNELYNTINLISSKNFVNPLIYPNQIDSNSNISNLLFHIIYNKEPINEEIIKNYINFTLKKDANIVKQIYKEVYKLGTIQFLLNSLHYDNDIIFDISNIPKPYIKEIKKLFKSEDIQHYFLSRIPVQNINKVTNCDSIKELGINMSHLKSDNSNIFTLPLFMINNDEDKEANILFETVKKIINADYNTIELINQLSSLSLPNEYSKDSVKYRIRCYLILILFHDFQTKNKSCNCILNALEDNQFQEFLFITPVERKLFEFFCSPVEEKPSNDNYHRWHTIFCSSDIEKYLYTNLIAVSLGIPNNKSHFSSIIFNHENISGCVPGSSASAIKDCGYIITYGTNGISWSGNGPLDTRLILGIFTWQSIAVSLFIKELTGTNDNRCRWCTQRNSFKSDIGKNNENWNMHQLISEYVMHRPTIMARYLMTLLENVDFVITQTLFSYWNTIFNETFLSNQQVQFSKSRFSYDEANAYTNLLESKLVRPTISNISGLLKRYTVENNIKKLITHNQDIEDIIKPFPSSNKINDIFPVSNNLLHYWKEKANLIGLLRNLPPLLSLYRFLLQKYNFRISEEEANTLLIKDIAPPNLKQVWDNTKQILGNLVGCPLAQENRRFELELAEFEQLTLAQCISYHDTGYGDHIFRIMKEIGLIQCKLIELIEDCTLDIDLEEISKDEMYNVSDLDILSTKLMHHKLINNQSQALQWNESLPMFIEKKDDSLQLNENMAALLLLEYGLSGCYSISIDQVRNIFHFSGSNESILVKDSYEISLDVIKRLKDITKLLTEKYSSKITFIELHTSSPTYKNWKASLFSVLRSNNQNTDIILLELGETCIKVIQKLLIDIGEYNTLNDIDIFQGGILFDKISSKVNIINIISFTQFVCDVLLQQDHQFGNQSNQLRVAVPKDIKKAINSIVEATNNEDEISSAIKYIQDIISNIFSQDNEQRVAGSLEIPLVTLFPDTFILSDNPLTHSLYPGSASGTLLQGKHYISYLGELNAQIGLLHLKLIELAKTKVSSDNIYHEYVPKEDIQLQVTLPGEELLEIATSEEEKSNNDEDDFLILEDDFEFEPIQSETNKSLENPFLLAQSDSSKSIIIYITLAVLIFIIILLFLIK